MKLVSKNDVLKIVVGMDVSLKEQNHAIMLIEDLPVTETKREERRDADDI